MFQRSFKSKVAHEKSWWRGTLARFVVETLVQRAVWTIVEEVTVKRDNMDVLKEVADSGCREV